MFLENRRVKPRPHHIKNGKKILVNMPTCSVTFLIFVHAIQRISTKGIWLRSVMRILSNRIERLFITALLSNTNHLIEFDERARTYLHCSEQCRTCHICLRENSLYSLGVTGVRHVRKIAPKRH